MKTPSLRGRALGAALASPIVVAAPAVAISTSPSVPLRPFSDADLAGLLSSPPAPGGADRIELRVEHRSPRSRRARLTKTGRVIAPAGAPRRVREIIRAANGIALKPYIWGGGHGSWKAAGYDCSGSVGYALRGARLIRKPVTSGALTSFGKPGRGRWVSVYAHGGHTYMVVAGLRFDTSARNSSHTRWTREGRTPAGYTVRHPAGL